MGWQRLGALVMLVGTAAGAMTSCASESQSPLLPDGVLVTQANGKYFLNFCFARPGALNKILGIDLEATAGFYAGGTRWSIAPALIPEKDGLLDAADALPTPICLKKASDR